MLGQEGPKHVAVCLLKQYCNANEVCAFVGNILKTSTECVPYRFFISEVASIKHSTRIFRLTAVVHQYCNIFPAEKN